MTNRTVDTSRDKKERLKVFLINKLKDRNGIVNEDANTSKILNEEASRLLGKPASEAELRKAEKRLMKRLMDKVGPAAIGGRTTNRGPMTGRESARGGMATGRSAISNATSVLSDFNSGMSARGTQQQQGGFPQQGGVQLPSVKDDGGYDYWLRFMEMDVRNFQREESKRREHEGVRIKKHRAYLDEQVAMKAKAKKAARVADLAWGVEIKKDYDKWQEEALVADAKVVEQRQRYIKATDEQLRRVDAARGVEIEENLQMDKEMLARVKVEMEREKLKINAKKEEEKKMLELMKIQNAKLKTQKEKVKIEQEREEIKLQKQYAEILSKQERAHKAKQKAFMEEIERKASRFDAAAVEERKKQEAMGLAGDAAEKKMIEDAKEQYRLDMIEVAEKERAKGDKVKKQFKDSLQLQLDAKAEKVRLEKEEVKVQMKELKKELQLASKKEEEKSKRIAQANYKNKLAIDAQIREKQRIKEVGRFMSQHEQEMNMNLIRKVEHQY